MKKTAVVTVLILIISSFNSCRKENAIGPKEETCPEYIPPSDLEPASRYFPNWELIDTLGLPRETKYEIYGSSNSDIWIMAQDDLYPNEEELSSKKVLHFDGINWTNVTKDIPVSQWTDLYKIWVPKENDVWIYGVSVGVIKVSIIFHFDGVSWKEFVDVENGPLGANNILPINPDEIYVTSGEYLHYWHNGLWSKYEARKDFFHSGLAKADGNIFITIWELDAIDSMYIYRLDDEKLKKVDSTDFWFEGSKVKFGMSLHGVGNKLYSNNMGGIYETTVLNGKPCQWEKTDVSPSLGTFHNFGDGNTWLGSRYVYPYHFNGVNYTLIIPDVENYEQYLPNPASIYANDTDVWIFDAFNGFIFHGWHV